MLQAALGILLLPFLLIIAGLLTILLINGAFEGITSVERWVWWIGGINFWTMMTLASMALT